MKEFGLIDAFGLILIIGGIIFTFVAWDKGLKTVDTWTQWVPAAGRLMFAFLIIWLGVQIIG